jgi:hypothetical protein
MALNFHVGHIFDFHCIYIISIYCWVFLKKIVWLPGGFELKKLVPISRLAVAASADAVSSLEATAWTAPPS